MKIRAKALHAELTIVSQEKDVCNTMHGMTGPPMIMG